MPSLLHTFRCVTLGMPALVVGGHPRQRAGEDGLAARRLGVVPRVVLSVQSPAFMSGGRIPSRCSADGANLSPALSWYGVPAEAKSLALIVEDPDAPTPLPFVHWLAYHVPPDQPGLPEGASHTGADFLVEGKNSKLKPGYLGAAPPSGDSAHRYHFQLFALDLAPGLGAGAGRSRLINALRGHVIAFGELVGTYQRLSDR